MKTLDMAKLAKTTTADDVALYFILGNDKYIVSLADKDVELKGSEVYLAIYYYRYIRELGNIKDPLHSRYCWREYSELYNQATIKRLMSVIVSNMPEDAHALERSTVISHILNGQYHRLIKIADRYMISPDLYDLYELADLPELEPLREQLDVNELKATAEANKVIMTNTLDNDITRMLKVGIVNSGSAIDNIFAKGTLTQANTKLKFERPIKESLLDIHLASSVITCSSDQHIAFQAHDNALGPANYSAKMIMTGVSGVDTLVDEPCDATHDTALQIVVTMDNARILHGSNYWDLSTNTYAMFDIANVTNLLGKLIHVRSPVMCKHPGHQVCRACLGKIANSYTRGNLSVALLGPVVDKSFNAVMKTKHNLRHAVIGGLSMFMNTHIINNSKHKNEWRLTKTDDLAYITVIAKLNDRVLPHILAAHDLSDKFIRESEKIHEIQIQQFDKDDKLIAEEIVDANATGGFKFPKNFIHNLCQLDEINFEEGVITFTMDMSSWDYDVPMVIAGNPKMASVSEQLLRWQYLHGHEAIKGATAPSPDVNERLREIIGSVSESELLGAMSLGQLSLRLRSNTMRADENGNIIDANPQPVGTPGIVLVKLDQITTYRGTEKAIIRYNKAIKGYLRDDIGSKEHVEMPHRETAYLTWRFKQWQDVTPQ